MKQNIQEVKYYLMGHSLATYIIQLFRGSTNIIIKFDEKFRTYRFILRIMKILRDRIQRF